MGKITGYILACFCLSLLATSVDAHHGAVEIGQVVDEHHEAVETGEEVDGGEAVEVIEEETEEANEGVDAANPPQQIAPAETTTATETHAKTHKKQSEALVKRLISKFFKQFG